MLIRMFDFNNITVNIRQAEIILNKSIGKKKNRPEFPDFFNIQNEKISDKTKISEAFNDYFSKIGLLTGQNVPHQA